MKRKRYIKAVSVLLCVVLMIMPLSGTVTAITDTTSSGTAAADSASSLPVGLIGDSDIPAAIDISTAQEKGHIQRLYDEEPDLNTVIFKNADGTKTVYY